MAEKKEELSPEVDLASLEEAVQAAADKVERAQSGEEEVIEPSFDAGPRVAVRKKQNFAHRFVHGFGGVCGEMFRALGDRDPAARKMALLFFVGVVGVVLAFTLAYRRYVKFSDLQKLATTGSEETSKNLGAFIEKQSEHAKKKFATLPLGKFTVDLKQMEGVESPRGVLNVAELEITLECDNKETRYYIEDHLTRARDQVTGVLTSVDREELLTRDGKRRLKKRLLDHLNAWLPEGKVEELFISNQLLN